MEEMSDFRFLHAADIHLDSPLTGLSRYEGLPAEEVRSATRAAFDNLIDYGCKELVDFIVIAGDVFDGDWRDMGTGLYFARAMGRLEQAGIPVFLLQGNHDAASVVTRSLPWPANVHRFGARAPQTFRLEHLGVALHGWSFAHQTAPDNLALRYPAAEAGAFNIGVLHTSLSGRPGHARYAPCEIADLKARGYDYWALGHVHTFEQVCDDPAVVFPGNLQGRNIRETGPKGAVLVEVQDRAIARSRGSRRSNSTFCAGRGSRSTAAAARRSRRSRHGSAIA
jgi:DNA repair exonuclease SbcCD nuclease subunit